MYGILLSCLGWCPWLLLGIVRQATKINVQDCWSFTCCFSWTLGSFLKCGQLLPFLQVLLWQIFFMTSSTGSTFFFSRQVYLLFCQITWFFCGHSQMVQCYKDVFVNSFFLHTARLWNSLPIECFPLTYGCSGFKSRINRHLLTVGSF